tara:strand:- start:4603 stop:6444 length:1842 start_codon:yes stop_codon:yes gene_type:complete
MKILGISGFYHDAAAALVDESGIVAAAQEERFTRIKHDPDFPKNAVNFCLDRAGIEVSDLDFVVFYEKPILKFDRLLETYLRFAPSGFNSFCKAMPVWLKDKLFHKRLLKDGLGGVPKNPFVFIRHHESHAASAFYPSPFKDAAILTMDGVGEWATASLALGKDNKVELLKEMHFPHSVGLLYSAFTYYCGFKVNSGEYKLMGLAPYGDPKYVETIKDNLVTIFDDGSIHLNMDYFNYCVGLTMTNQKFERLFGAPARKGESQIGQREMDLAASIQVVTEEVMIKMARHAKEVTGSHNLCLAGGVALNCVGNGKILKENIFENIWIQPASGDAGGALGAAQFCRFHLNDKPREASGYDSQKASLLGPHYKDDEVKSFLDSEDAIYQHFENESELLESVARHMSHGKVVGWFQGKMEFGPRALGARSIIGDARNPEMQSVMNRKIKFRESFRPFAPCVLNEDVSTYFDLDKESPYMLIVAPVAEEQRTRLTEEQKRHQESKDLRERVNVKRSAIPAITHVDYSARVQTVDEKRHGRYYRLIKEFKNQTGCGVIINTSFNIRGEPIVCRPSEAYRCFMNTYMDVLVLENVVLVKSDQKNLDESYQERYRREFPLD